MPKKLRRGDGDRVGAGDFRRVEIEFDDLIDLVAGDIRSFFSRGHLDLFGLRLAEDDLCAGDQRQIRDLIEAAGASLLYLPPYSPDFNPIEYAFAKLKALLRKAAERTVDGLWAAIGRLINTFTPQECANYFAAAGYDAT